MSEQKRTFEPTQKQLDFLEVYCRPGLKKSVVSICEEAQVSRTAYYEWVKEQPDFEEWLMGEYNKSRRRLRPLLVDAQAHKALEGDTQAYKAYMLTDETLQYRPVGTGVSISAGGPVEIVIAAQHDDPDSE